jgi:hypothetical protein
MLSPLESRRHPGLSGAEGFVRYPPVAGEELFITLTSLADDGSEGTFRWAIKKGGRRTIVFDGSGTID